MIGLLTLDEWLECKLLPVPCACCKGAGSFMHVGERDRVSWNCRECNGTGICQPELQHLTRWDIIALQRDYIEYLWGQAYRIEQELKRMEWKTDASAKTTD